MYYRTFGQHGQPITVLYPGYYSNISNYPIMKTAPIPYYPQHNTHQYPRQQQFSDVDPSLFNESAISMQKLMSDASIVLKAIADSKVFAKKIMTAAQESHLEEVEQLIKSTGIKSGVDTSFNPDGINLKLSSSIHGAECCHLTIALRWR